LFFIKSILKKYVFPLTGHIYSTSQKFDNITIFNVSEISLLCSLSLHLFDQKYRKNSNMVKYYNNLKQWFSIWIYFKIYFISLMQSWIFSYYFSPQCHMILQKPQWQWRNW